MRNINKIKKLSYVLLSPHAEGDARSRHFLNVVYESWKNTFSDVVHEAGEELRKDDFFRYDHIGAIFDGDVLVASHCFSFFDLSLNCCREHHVMVEIGPTAVQKLIDQGQTELFSLEYSQVLPQFRKSQTGVNWLEILTSCGLFCLDESSAHGIIGTPRIDVKVDRATYRLGAIELVPPIKKMNYSCAVVFFPRLKGRIIEDEEVHEVSRGLWLQRECFNTPMQLGVQSRAS